MAGWIVVALGGWLWGSFLNQCVDRLGDLTPRPPLPRGEGESVGGPVSLLHPPRSICLACGARIPWFDNLPILSYLLLRGRCRRCALPIGRRTLVMECVTPLIALAIFAVWGWSAAFVGAALAASWTLVAVPMRLEGRAWSVGWTWLGVALWTAFFWSVTLGAFLPR